MYTYEIGISGIGDGHNSDPEELTGSSSEGDVGSLVPREGEREKVEVSSCSTSLLRSETPVHPSSTQSNRAGHPNDPAKVGRPIPEV